jgi:type II secretory pathway pseudopilin PulG
MNRTFHSRAAGFTLIEIALALMVASMGLLVIMGLFVDGLATQQTTVDETQSALFAEEVLHSVRALAPERWNGLSTIMLPAPAGDLWKPGEPERVTADGKINTLRYVYDGEEDVQDFALRYKLEIDDVPNSNRKRVRLEVWGGEFGDLDRSRVYYTEVFNTRFK